MCLSPMRLRKRASLVANGGTTRSAGPHIYLLQKPRRAARFSPFPPHRPNFSPRKKQPATRPLALFDARTTPYD
jgi:hypothetical protein